MRRIRRDLTHEQTVPVIGGNTTDAIMFDDGEVSVNSNSTDAVSLAGVSFRCAPVGEAGCLP